LFRTLKDRPEREESAQDGAGGFAIMHALHGQPSILNGTESNDLMLADGNHEKVFVALDKAMAEAVIEAVRNLMSLTGSRYLMVTRPHH